MDQARSTISKIFNGEPRSYTRFNLTQNMEGENSQVEMKLSSDMDEEVGGNGVGEHLNHARDDCSYVRKPSQRSPKNVCFVVIATLLLFVIGYLIGYLAHRKQDIMSLSCPEPTLEYQVFVQPEAAVSLNWEDLVQLLRTKLTTSSIENSFSEFSSDSHQAGSPGDEALGNKVMKRFKDYEMNTWSDEHFVKIQDPPTSGRNQVTCRGEDIGQTPGYLAYSGIGRVEGAVLYAHYGQVDDFRHLQDIDVDFNGKVILVRAGKICFAEKVANAAALNASAVLIYPDPTDYLMFGENTDLFGHVHLGTGDPYTPAFPSFNHTQFPPAQSSGLPSIPAQTITASMATKIMSKMGGRDPPRPWADGALPGIFYKLGDDGNNVVTVEVNNVLTDKKIHNVFGVIKGFVDSDRYVVIGAQRDAWGPGFARSTVGTSILVELAAAITDMIKNEGFKPRRSIIFASWSAGEYGSVGATEWLEAYLGSLNMKAFSYISLDGAVIGFPSFKASASPLMYDLIESTLKGVSSPQASTDPSRTLYDVAGDNWDKKVMEPMRLADAAYPFLAFSGIPSVSFRFTSVSSDAAEYPYFGTMLDTKEKLDSATSYNTAKLARVAAEIAGQMALRLVHDHLLRLNAEEYGGVIRTHVISINGKVGKLQRSARLPKTLTMQWLISALGTFNRAASHLRINIVNSDLSDVEQCRIINDRIMSVERNLLSPYVSPREAPFRHILMGSGSHTLRALSEHLDALGEGSASADVDMFRNQFALATWTIQGCANALAGDVWYKEM